VPIEAAEYLREGGMGGHTTTWERPMKTIQRLVWVVLLGSSFEGCGDAAGPNELDMAGQYTLQSMGGAAVPGMVNESPNSQLYVTGGLMEIGADDAYTLIVAYRYTAGDQVSFSKHEENGVVRSRRGGIVFQERATGYESSGSLSGGTLTVTIDRLPLVFVRE
jgi:hypothetical protein